MTSTDTLCQILYVSQLVPGSNFGAVGDIIAMSRRANPAHGVTGALLFDGEYFGQLLEGSEDHVAALMHRIETDPRHRAITPVLRRPAAAPRLMRIWRSGYCEAQQLESFIVDASLRGAAALNAFLVILRGADVE
ncbi:MAG: BLUF domain-containing protein [Burkholderiales bacterium]